MVLKKWYFGGAAVMLLLGQMVGCGKSEDVAASKDMTYISDKVNDDIAEIVVAFPVMNTHSESGVKRVMDAINDICINEINTSVQLLPIEVGNYGQQMSLMLSSNEQIDLMPTFYYGPTTYASMMAQKQMMPLNDLLKQYGQGITSILPDYFLDTTTVNEQIYAVPVYKDEVPNVYIAMRKDILSELELQEKVKQIDSVQDLEEIFELVKNNTDLYPVASDANMGVLAYLPILYDDKFSEGVVYEDLLNGTVVVMDEDSDTVVSLFHTDIFESVCKLTRKWYENDYIYINEAGDNTQSYPNVFSVLVTAENSTYKSAMAAAESQGYKYEMIKIGSGLVTTSTINTIDWVIPVNSKEPEAAMKFLNLMYTNKDIVDLLNYGVEGEDYVVSEDGTYTFPEGINASNAQYYDNLTWLFGNQYLSGVWEGADPDTREVSAQINKNAKLSSIIGFSADISNLETEIAAVSNTYNEFFGSLSKGLVDVDEALPQFRKKLEDNGIEKIISSIQQQLDSWKGEQLEQ